MGNFSASENAYFGHEPPEKEKADRPGEMQEKINKILMDAGYLYLLSARINASTDLSVRIRPLTYDVVLGGKNIVSCNCPENAVTIYRAMLADFKGDLYHG